MESNYLKSAMIKIKQHPEWDEKRIQTELDKVCIEEYSLHYFGEQIWCIPIQDYRPAKFIYEGGII